MKLRYFYISVLCVSGLLACTPEVVDPVGFQAVDYTTNPSEAQVFDFYYDDGQKVTNALQHPMVSVKTAAGSFTDEKPMVLNFTEEIKSIPDSIVPFTYYFQLSYPDSLLKDAEYRMHYTFPYTNVAHTTRIEEAFFLDHLDQMKLLKLEPEENGELYYDPYYTISEIPYTIDAANEDIVFNTRNLNALYSLCWYEKPWRDSIYFSIDDGDDANQIQIREQGIRTRYGSNTEGATLVNKVLELNYTADERSFETDTNFTGWSLDDLSVSVKNPKEGLIASGDIVIDCSLRAFDNTVTKLQVSSQTTIQMEKWSDYNQESRLTISGSMLVESSQTNVPVRLKIYFIRQR